MGTEEERQQQAILHGEAYTIIEAHKEAEDPLFKIALRLAEAESEKEMLEERLGYLLAILIDREDVEDGSDGQPRPNEAMQILTQYEQHWGWRSVSDGIHAHVDRRAEGVSDE